MRPRCGTGLEKERQVVLGGGEVEVGRGGGAFKGAIQGEGRGGRDMRGIGRDSGRKRGSVE